MLNLKKIRPSTILNVIGLSIAFTAFIIIMIQVRYDLGFNKNIKNWEEVYRVEMVFSEKSPDVYNPYFPRQMVSQMFAATPGVEIYTTMSNNGRRTFHRENHESSTGVYLKEDWYSKEVEDVFGIDLTLGDIKSFQGPQTLLISESTADLLFKDENPIGQGIVSNNTVLKVVGVFRDYPQNSILNLDIIRNLEDYHADVNPLSSYQCYIKKDSNTSIENVEKALNDAFLVHAAKYGSSRFDGIDRVLRFTNLHDLYFSNDIRYDPVEKGNLMSTWSLFAVALLIIAIAIINFINFSMAMVPIKIRSINTRKILGSTNNRLRAELILQSSILSLFSFLFALILVYVIGGTSFASLISADLELGANIPIVITTLVVAISSSLIAGIYPSIYATSFSPAFVIKGSFSLSPKGRKLRTTLISAQYIISIVLIIVAIFIKVQTDFMKNYDTGYQKENVLTVELGETVAKQKTAFVQELKNNPSIIDIAFSDGPILSDGKMGWGKDYKGEQILFDCFPVDPNFISFFGMEIIDGKNFEEGDKLKRSGTVIFNQKATKAFGLAVGDQIGGHNDLRADVVGIVKDFNFQPLQYVINPIALYVYGTEPWALYTTYQSFMYVKIGQIEGESRGATPEQTKSVMEHIRTTITKFNPNYADPNVEFLDQTEGRIYQREEDLSSLILYACILSVLISIIGVLGLTLFETQYRRKEIGIRKVFGAQAKNILIMFNRKYIKITLICCFIGSPIAYFIVTKILSNYAYHSPIHMGVFLGAFAIILVITTLTVTLECLRAANENPVKTIK